MTQATLYMVGGAVRDLIMGNDNPKDIDFAVEAKSFAHMRQWMDERGFDVHIETPKYFTIRAKAPRSGFMFAGRDYSGKSFDFALCRTDGEYLDGRRPEAVEVGTIETDLSRRDFAMNAVAMDRKGQYLDPFGGQAAIEHEEINCVGSTERLTEDGLRVMRALRFHVQLGFTFDLDVYSFLRSEAAVEALRVTENDRIRQELHKALKIDTGRTLHILYRFPKLTKYIFEETPIWLKPTDEKK